MSRVNTVFMSRVAAYQSGPVLSATDIQIGDEVLAWVHPEEQAPPIALPGVLVGVHVDVDTLSFDIAFEVAQTGVFTVARNLVTRVTRRDEDYEGNRVGVEQAQRPVPRKPTLQVITRPVNKESQLLADEAAANAAEREERSPQESMHALGLTEPEQPQAAWSEDGSLPVPTDTPVGPVAVVYLCGTYDWLHFLQELPVGAVETLEEPSLLPYEHIVSYMDFPMAQADIQRFDAQSRQSVPTKWPDTEQKWRFLDVAFAGSRLRQRT